MRPSKGRPIALRIDPPIALGALDLGRLAADLLVDALAQHSGHLGPGDAERAHAALGHDPARLGKRDDLRYRGIDALRKVPQPLPPATPARRDLSTCREELQHLRHVAVAGPAARLPGHDARVRDVAGLQRVSTLAAEWRTSRRKASLTSSQRPAAGPGTE